MPDEREYSGNADMEQDVTAIRRVALAFLAVVVICIGLAVFLTHKSIPSRPQASVVATPSPEINTAESEGKAATSIEDNTVPSHSVLDQDWRPYLKGTVDAPAPEAPVADVGPLPDASDLRPVTDAPAVAAPAVAEPTVEATVAPAALPPATAADEAQHAHDYPLRRRRHHYHRPHHHHHRPQPQRHVSACPDYAIDYYDPFAALFHGLECLFEEMIQ